MINGILQEINNVQGKKVKINLLFNVLSTYFYILHSRTKEFRLGFRPVGLHEMHFGSDCTLGNEKQILFVECSFQVDVKFRVEF